jgi:cytochrome c551/c552
MIPCKPVIQKLTRLLLFFGVFIAINKVSAQDGKAIFQSKCASCHVMGRDMTGPNLQGVIDRWGGNTDQIHVWIHNWAKAVQAGYPRALEVEKFSSSSMTQFESGISDAEIDAVLKYVNDWAPPAAPTSGPGDNGEKTDNSGAVIFGVISLILAIIALILMQVNSNLKKLSDDAEGIHRPEPVPFYRNKVYIAMIAIIFFVIAGFFLSEAAIGLGRQ